MYLRLATATLAWLFLMGEALAEEYRGHIVKVEKDKLTLKVSRQGSITKSVKIDPPVNMDFARDETTRFLNIRAKEVMDEETKQKIMKLGEYVIIKTEKKEKDKKEKLIMIQAVGG